MSDRTTEIREAVDLLKGSLDAPRLTPSQILAVGFLMKEARAYADLLDSDPLIIRRDENGRWDQAAVEAMYPPLDAWDAFLDWQGVVEAQLDALAGHLDLDALAAVVDTPKETR